MRTETGTNTEFADEEPLNQAAYIINAVNREKARLTSIGSNPPTAVITSQYALTSNRPSRGPWLQHSLMLHHTQTEPWSVAAAGR